MRAGLLRHRVILQKPDPTSARDSVGERVTTWLDIATVDAQIRPLNAREQFLAAQRQASTTHAVTVRYGTAISALDASWRVKFGTRYFVIDGVTNPDERNRVLEISCIEGRGDE